MRTIVVVGVLLAAGGAAQPKPQPQPRCGTPIEREHSVCQRCYEQLDNEAFGKRVYLYVPDIKSKALGGFDPFDVWIVEGVYGPPFLDYGGVFDQSKFERLQKTGNVVVTRVPVDKNRLGKAQSFKVGKNAFQIEPTRVLTSFGGTDRVALKICR
jgi:hypothetical protein